MSLIDLSFTFEAWIKEHICWSLNTFGTSSRPEGIIKHIRKELHEIERSPEDLHEWIDVIILAVDGAWRQGYSAEQIIQALINKQLINFNRKWPSSTDQAEAEPTEHIKEEV